MFAALVNKGAMHMTTRAKKAIQARSAYGPVRITIPAKVAYDLPSLNKGIDSLLDKLGCRACFSGADCTFLHERDFIINERLEAVAGPLPDPWREQQFRPVVVSIDRETSYNVEAVKSVIENVLGKLGCAPCHSGFDITFRHEWEQQLGRDFNARILNF